MLRMLLRSKIHRATVTDVNLDYEGSLTVDEALLDAAGILPYEQVMVSNLQNGERFETYVIPAQRGSGVICLNGPAARKGVVGDRLVVFCYGSCDEQELEKHEPTIVKVDGENRVQPG